MPDQPFLRIRFPSTRTAHITECTINGNVIHFNGAALCGRMIPDGSFPAVTEGYDCMTCRQLWWKVRFKELEGKALRKARKG